MQYNSSNLVTLTGRQTSKAEAEEEARGNKTQVASVIWLLAPGRVAMLVARRVAHVRADEIGAEQAETKQSGRSERRVRSLTQQRSLGAEGATM